MAYQADLRGFVANLVASLCVDKKLRNLLLSLIEMVSFSPTVASSALGASSPTVASSAFAPVSSLLVTEIEFIWCHDML